MPPRSDFRQYGRETTLLDVRPRPGTRAYARDTGNVFMYTESGWQQLGTTVGPTGPTGSAGATGPTGETGPTGPTGP